MVAADALPQFEKEAKKRQGTRTDKHPDKNVRKSRAVDDASQSFCVSATHISTAKAIKKKSPKLAREVRDGKTTLSKAKRQIKREENREKAKRTPSSDPSFTKKSSQ